jgi:hypothetical protein
MPSEKRQASWANSMSGTEVIGLLAINVDHLCQLSEINAGGATTQSTQLE